MQLRNVTTNARNIYVYELNDNFNDSNETSYILDIPPTLESCNIMTSVSGRQVCEYFIKTKIASMLNVFF